MNPWQEVRREMLGSVIPFIFFAGEAQLQNYNVSNFTRRRNAFEIVLKPENNGDSHFFHRTT